MVPPSRHCSHFRGAFWSRGRVIQHGRHPVGLEACELCPFGATSSTSGSGSAAAPTHGGQLGKPIFAGVLSQDTLGIAERHPFARPPPPTSCTCAVDELARTMSWAAPTRAECPESQCSSTSRPARATAPEHRADLARAGRVQFALLRTLTTGLTQ